MKKGRVKQIIKEEVGKFVAESVDVMVADYPYQKTFENLLDVSYYIQNKLFHDYLPKKLSGNELKNAQDAIRGETITPDGDDHFDRTGTINFYLKETFPRELLEDIYSYFKYILSELDITLGQPRLDRSNSRNGAVARLPIVNNENTAENGPPDINLANGNARLIFSDVLNYGNEYDGHSSFDAVDLIMKINVAENMLFGHPDKTTRDTSTPKNMYSDIKGKDYIVPVLQRIKKLAQWAIDNGYRSINVA